MCSEKKVTLFWRNCIFTALHAMQTRSSDENSVCLSVRPSVTRVHCDKTVERSVQIYIPYKRTFILVFWEEEWLVGGRPLLGEILGQRVRVLCCSLCFSAQFLVHFFRNGGDRGLRVRAIILLRQYGFDVCLFVCLWRVDRLFVTSWPCDELTVTLIDT